MSNWHVRGAAKVSFLCFWHVRCAAKVPVLGFPKMGLFLKIYVFFVGFFYFPPLFLFRSLSLSLSLPLFLFRSLSLSLSLSPFRSLLSFSPWFFSMPPSFSLCPCSLSVCRFLNLSVSLFVFNYLCPKICWRLRNIVNTVSDNDKISSKLCSRKPPGSNNKHIWQVLIRHRQLG